MSGNHLNDLSKVYLDKIAKINATTAIEDKSRWQDLGGPTPENYKSDDDSAKLKVPGATLKQVKDVVNKGAKPGDQTAGTLKKEESEAEGNVVAEEEVSTEEVVAESEVTENEVVSEEETTEEEANAHYGVKTEGTSQKNLLRQLTLLSR